MEFFSNSWGFTTQSYILQFTNFILKLRNFIFCRSIITSCNLQLIKQLIHFCEYIFLLFTFSIDTPTQIIKLFSQLLNKRTHLISTTSQPIKYC